MSVIAFRENNSGRDFNINPEDEYLQSEPQFSYSLKEYTLDEISMRKIIAKCGRHGMWIFVTLFENNESFWLNIKEFNENKLSGYTVVRLKDRPKYRKKIDINLNDIKNLECYDPFSDKSDNQDDLISIYYITNYCLNNRGKFLGKSYLDITDSVSVYYEVYECGVYTELYIDKIYRTGKYIPRSGEYVDISYYQDITPISKYHIIIDVGKLSNELQQRLRIWVYEIVFYDLVNENSWKIKLPWA